MSFLAVNTKKAKKINIHHRSANKNVDDTKPKLKLPKFDSAIFVIILVMLAYGVIMVFSASYPAALQKTGNSFHFISKHILFVVVGIIVAYGVSFLDYHIYRRFALALLIVSTVLLVLTPLIGENYGTFATRWLRVGPIDFQPSEIAKLTVIVVFSHLIASNYKRMKQFKYGIIPFVVILAVICGLLYLEPHISAIMLVLGIGVIMMYVGGTKIIHLLSLAGCGGALIGVYFLVQGFGKSTEHVGGRLEAWLDPFSDILGDGWQTVQSLVAIGSGGIMGKGIGMSVQKQSGYLPEPYNDYIFSIICEELGLIGALFVVLLFVLFAYRGFSIAVKAPDKFGAMMALGITVQVCLQAMLNIAVVTNAVPPTGISLPFFSYGGTALLMMMGQMGILLNISRKANIEKP